MYRRYFCAPASTADASRSVDKIVQQLALRQPGSQPLPLEVLLSRVRILEGVLSHVRFLVREKRGEANVWVRCGWLQPREWLNLWVLFDAAPWMMLAGWFLLFNMIAVATVLDGRACYFISAAFLAVRHVFPRWPFAFVLSVSMAISVGRTQLQL